MESKTFHFIVNGDGWIALDDGPQENAISITFSMKDLENGKTYYIVPGTHYATLVDKWEVNGIQIIRLFIIILPIHLQKLAL